MSAYEKSYPLGFNEKFEALDYKLDIINKKLEETQVLNYARYLRIIQEEDGTVELSFLNTDREVIDTQEITLTGKIIKDSSVDLENKVITLNCLDGSSVTIDMTDIIDDYNTKITTVNERVTAEITRATTAEGTKVDKIAGKGLSTNDYTTAEKDKLTTIESGAQVNIIEDVKVDGASLEVTNKSVNIDLSGKVDKITGKGLSEADYTNAEKTKLAGIESNAEVNIIESIEVDDEELPVVNKKVSIDLSGKVDKVTGKGLSTNDFTDTLKGKLDAVEAEAQVNIIEVVKVNGVALPISSKAVNVDITGKVDKVSEMNKIYGTNSAGQTTYNLDAQDVDVTAGNIVKRNTRGTVTVLGTPVQDTDASSKAYTDTFAKSLDLSIDENYAITATLKDKNGNVLYNGVVDLPIEYDVVGGRFDSDTKTLILVLRNGTEVSIGLASMLTGLQAEITASNPLSSNLVSDTGSTEHQFITASQKEQINVNRENINLKANKADVFEKDEVTAFLGTKQDALAQQTSFISKGSANKIPQVSTNNLGQVVNVTEIPIDALSSSTRYGASLQMSLDSSSYLLTLQLVDQAGQVLGTPQYVSLPLENIIVDASYNSVTRQIILTLNNGTQIVIPVGDIVNGLVNESRTIAGIDLTEDITAQALTNALFTVTDVTIDEEE